MDFPVSITRQAYQVRDNKLHLIPLRHPGKTVNVTNKNRSHENSGKIPTHPDNLTDYPDTIYIFVYNYDGRVFMIITAKD